jgi:hypothetical protein
MAKKEWIGPLRQSTKGKRPWVCDYACPLSGKKKRQKIAEAGANKKDRERLYHDFGRSLTDGRFVTKESATFNDALDGFERWCEQRHRTKDRMSAGRLEKVRDALRVHLRPDRDSIRHPAADSDRRPDDLAIRGDKAHPRCRAATVACWRAVLSCARRDFYDPLCNRDVASPLCLTCWPGRHRRGPLGTRGGSCLCESAPQVRRSCCGVERAGSSRSH